MFLAMTVRYLIVIFNPMANFDFECFRKKSSGKGTVNNTTSRHPEITQGPKDYCNHAHEFNR